MKRILQIITLLLFSALYSHLYAQDSNRRVVERDTIDNIVVTIIENSYNERFLYEVEVLGRDNIEKKYYKEIIKNEDLRQTIFEYASSKITEDRIICILSDYVKDEDKDIFYSEGWGFISLTFKTDARLLKYHLNVRFSEDTKYKRLFSTEDCAKIFKNINSMLTPCKETDTIFWGTLRFKCNP